MARTGRPPKPKVTKEFLEGNEALQIKRDIISTKQERVLKNIDSRQSDVKPVELDEKEQRVTGFYQEMRVLPIISIDNSKQVRNRITKYWDMIDRYGMCPSFESLSCALGVSRKLLYNIVNDLRKTTPQDIVEMLTQAVELVNSQANSYAEYGKTVPVLRIWNSKNNFGYRDQVEVIAHNNTVREESVEDLLADAKRIASGAIPGDGEVE